MKKKEPKFTITDLPKGSVGELVSIQIDSSEVLPNFCKHHNQGEGKCFDCGKLI